ncbi:uncharacterized protein [Epargyreus clarus]|uniref:uncharacterized protein isoform X2 n=1 Tax=Epargyreus clarus TaxID=520877 RepID=UPI003C2F0191
MAKWKLCRQTYGTDIYEFTEGDEVTIGRGTQNTIILASLNISRRHCIINVKRDEVTIVDLASANGIFVGLKKIAPNVPFSLSENDIIGIGWTDGAPLAKVNDAEKFVFKLQKIKNASVIDRIKFQSENDLQNVQTELAALHNSQDKQSVKKCSPTSLSLKRKSFTVNQNHNENNKEIANNISHINIENGNNVIQSPIKKFKSNFIFEEIKEEPLIKVENEDLQYEAFNIKQECCDDEPQIIIDSDSSDSDSEHWYARLSQNSPRKSFINFNDNRKSDVQQDSSYSQLDDDVVYVGTDFKSNNESDEELYLDDLITILPPPINKDDDDKYNKQNIEENNDISKTIENNILNKPPDATSIVKEKEKVKTHFEEAGKALIDIAVQSNNAVSKTTKLIDFVVQPSKKSDNSPKSKIKKKKDPARSKTISTKIQITNSQKEERKKKLREIASKEKADDKQCNPNLSKNDESNSTSRVNAKITPSNRGAFLVDEDPAISKPKKRKSSADSKHTLMYNVSSCSKKDRRNSEKFSENTEIKDQMPILSIDVAKGLHNKTTNGMLKQTVPISSPSHTSENSDKALEKVHSNKDSDSVISKSTKIKSSADSKNAASSHSVNKSISKKDRGRSEKSSERTEIKDHTPILNVEIDKMPNNKITNGMRTNTTVPISSPSLSSHTSLNTCKALEKSHCNKDSDPIISKTTKRKSSADSKNATSSHNDNERSSSKKDRRNIEKSSECTEIKDQGTILNIGIDKVPHDKLTNGMRKHTVPTKSPSPPSVTSESIDKALVKKHSNKETDNNNSTVAKNKPKNNDLHDTEQLSNKNLQTEETHETLSKNTGEKGVSHETKLQFKIRTNLEVIPSQKNQSGPKSSLKTILKPLKENKEPDKKSNKRVSFSKNQPEVREFEIEQGHQMKKTSSVKTTLLPARYNLPAFSLEKFALMRILRWNPQWLDEQNNFTEPPPILGHNNIFKAIPHTFSSHTQYVELVGDLLLMEIWDCLSQGYVKTQNEKTYHQMRIESLPLVLPQKHDLQLFNLSVNVSVPTTHAKFVPREGEIMMVYFGGEIKFCRFFFVHNVRCLPSPPNNVNSFYSISLQASFTEKITMLQRGAIMYGKSLAYINKDIRLYEAMEYLSRSPLNEVILNPQPEHFLMNDADCRFNMESQWTTPLNESQKKAVIHAVSAAFGDKPRIQMVQGPPGTGKSRVICAIVMSYFYDALGKKQKNRGKILICATSNAAVDELVIRLLDIRQSLPHPERLNMVRVGRADAMHPRARDISSTRLAQRDAARALPDAAPGLSAEISLLEAKRNKWQSNIACATDDARVAYCQNRIAEITKKIAMDAADRAVHRGRGGAGHRAGHAGAAHARRHAPRARRRPAAAARLHLFAESKEIWFGRQPVLAAVVVLGGVGRERGGAAELPVPHAPAHRRLPQPRLLRRAGAGRAAAPAGLHRRRRALHRARHPQRGQVARFFWRQRDGSVGCGARGAGAALAAAPRGPRARPRRRPGRRRRRRRSVAGRHHAIRGAARPGAPTPACSAPGGVGRCERRVRRGGEHGGQLPGAGARRGGGVAGALARAGLPGRRGPHERAADARAPRARALPQPRRAGEKQSVE